MFLLLVLIAQISAEPPSADIALIPYREIPSDFLNKHRSRIALSNFFPRSIGKKTKKFQISYGGNGFDQIDDRIERIPPFHRIHMLAYFFDRWTKYPCLLRVVDSYADTPEGKSYMKFLAGNTHVEREILDKIFDGIYPERRHPALTATELAQKFQTELSVKFGYSLNFLTPRILMDWFDVFFQPGKMHLRIASELIPPGNPEMFPIPNTALINLEINSFRALLKRRRHRLIITGYENIDF